MKRFFLSILIILSSISINGCTATGGGYSQSSNSVEDRLNRLESRGSADRARRRINALRTGSRYY